MTDVDPRERAVSRVLRDVHPDRRSAEVVDAAPVEEGTLFGVKAPPQGYFSQAKYAVVVVDDRGTVREATACTRRELRRRIEAAGDGQEGDHSQ